MSKQRPPSSVEFIARLKESGLVNEEDTARLAASSADAETLARGFIQRGLLTKFQASALYCGRPPLLLGNYLLLEKIASGGIGDIYRGRHRHMDRPVAVKLIRDIEQASPQSKERFQREVKLAARLTHPHIVTTHDAGLENGYHYLVMELLRGEDLSSLLRKGKRFSAAKAIELILQAARGLQYAHGEGIIHRDIKPRNLFLCDGGVLKILDLGLSKLSDAGLFGADQDELTRGGEIAGTVDYMAPEQALDLRSADQRSDIYSLGCTLFALLAGRPPFPGDTVVQKLVAHREAPPPILPRGVPSALQDIFRRMVAKNPADRFSGMEGVIEALEGCTQAEPLHEDSFIPDAAIVPSIPAAMVERPVPPPLPLRDSRLDDFEMLEESKGFPPLHSEVKKPFSIAAIPRFLEAETRVGIPRWCFVAAGAAMIGIVLASILAGALLRGSKPEVANSAVDPKETLATQGSAATQLEAQRKENIRNQVQGHIEEIKQLARKISELAGKARNQKKEIDKLVAASVSVRTDEKNIQAEFDSAGSAEKQREFLSYLRSQAPANAKMIHVELQEALQEAISLGVKANSNYTQATNLMKGLSQFDVRTLQKDLDNAVYPATDGRKEVESIATEMLPKIRPVEDKLAAARLIITRMEGQIKPKENPEVPAKPEVKPEVPVMEGNPFREMKPYASLPLPSTDLTSASAGSVSLIGPLQGLQANKLQLELIGGSQVLQPSGTFRLAEERGVDFSQWNVIRQGALNSKRLGVFFVSNRGLQFRWEEGIDGQGDEKSLQNCRLKLASGEHRWELQLSKPRSIPLTLAFENVPLFFVEGFPIPPVPAGSQIIVVMQLQNIEGLSHASPLIMPIPVTSSSVERRAAKNLFEGIVIKENELLWPVEAIVKKINAPPAGSQVMQLQSEFLLPGYKGDYINRTSDAVQLAQLASMSKTMKSNGTTIHAFIYSPEGPHNKVKKQEEVFNLERARLAEAKNDSAKKAIRPKVEEAGNELNKLRLQMQRKEAERDEYFAIQKMADRAGEIIQKIKDGGQLVITVKARVFVEEQKFYDIDLIQLDSALN